MPTAITDLRASLAAALANAGVWSTFSFPPANILANSVVVVPADPYLTPSNNTFASISPLANFKIMLTTPLFDNQGNLSQIETMAVAVFNKLAASSLVMNVGSMSAPTVLNAASGDLLTCEISVSTLTTWS